MPGLPLSLVRSPPGNRATEPPKRNIPQPGYMFVGPYWASAVKLQPPVRGGRNFRSACYLGAIMRWRQAMDGCQRTVALIVQLPNSSWCLSLCEMVNGDSLIEHSFSIPVPDPTL